MVSLYDHQKAAINKMRSGSILRGGVGSGKSITALVYYLVKECKAKIDFDGLEEPRKMRDPKDLYIITTARKRDTLEWDKECAKFALPSPFWNVNVIIDSWNKIQEYVDVSDSFFIFDEQRASGSGEWVKAFLKITKKNNWILLSATPGDSWLDYIPVFIANGFYPNRTAFLREHAVYDRYAKYPKINRWINVQKLINYQDRILVNMNYEKKTMSRKQYFVCDYDRNAYKRLMRDRWDIFDDDPIKNISKLCSLLRRVSNTNPDRFRILGEILSRHQTAIIFYNFNYELEMLREYLDKLNRPYSEWNGEKHEQILEGDKWCYLVQYNAGSEGWNCIKTNVIIFFSQNYSYRMMTQAAGRIDRLNTPFTTLWYYYIRSSSPIDSAIFRTLKNKETFNESAFIQSLS